MAKPAAEPISAPKSAPKGALGHARPETYEELLAVLSSGAGQLPKRLRQVAVFLTQHPNEVALNTISTVAAGVGVQPSTLVRFAQIFGFSGFSEFQELFKAHLKSGIAGGAAARRPDDGIARPAVPHALSGLIAAASQSLARLDETFDAAAFDRVVAILSEARPIHLIGSKRAFPVASYMSLALSQHGIRNSLVANIGSDAFDQIACLGPGDGVLAISFSPYNSITPDLAERARDRGAAVAAITDSPLSPLIRTASASLIVVEAIDAGYRSLAATMVTGLAVVLAVASRRASGRENR